MKPFPTRDEFTIGLWGPFKIVAIAHDKAVGWIMGVEVAGRRFQFRASLRGGKADFREVLFSGKDKP